MTQTFTTNSNNDLFIDQNGNLSISTGLTAVLQACQNAVKAQLGEMIYNTSAGIPNFQNVWTGVVNEQQWEVAIATALENVQNVVNVVSIDVNIVNNVISYSATILTTFGQGSLNDNF